MHDFPFFCTSVHHFPSIDGVILQQNSIIYKNNKIMKKAIFLVAALFATVFVNAQTDIDMVTCSHLKMVRMVNRSLLT